MRDCIIGYIVQAKRVLTKYTSCIRPWQCVTFACGKPDGCINTIAAAAHANKSIRRRYFRALCLMETRFPISRDSGQVHVSFVWYDAFRHSKKTEQCSIHFEKASVLFNLAAILTQQALNADRTADAGRKEAAKFFQVSHGLSVLAMRPICALCQCAKWTSFPRFS